jgi:hypothetical protein
MRFHYLALTSLLLAGCATNFALSPHFDLSKTYTLAVLPPRAVSGVDSSDLGGLYDYADLTFMQTGHFSVLERTRIDAVLKEQAFGASGLTDPGSAVSVGKLLQADAIALLNVTAVKPDSFFVAQGNRDACDVELFVKILSCTTGEILYSSQGNGTGQNGRLEALQMALSQALYGITHNKGGH